ncbi:unnamed protein product [Closterium sp. Naga37s-1]|nr:unnamed protein product [Closterium sp. Naga37s-1]
MWKAHVDTYNAVYPALLAELGAGRQVENDCCASMLVQVLGVKESGDLQEGFGFFVRHLLSYGLENAHAEGRRGAGEKDSACVGHGQRWPWHGGCGGGRPTGGGGRCSSWGQGAHPTGSMEDAAIEAVSERLRQAGLARGVSEGRATGGGGLELAASAAPTTRPPAPSAATVSPRAGSSLCSSGSTGNSGMLNPSLVPSPVVNRNAMLSSRPSGLVPVNTDPALGLLTYRVACILQWLRIYGSDFISAKTCFKDNPQGRVMPMRHPVQDRPNLLARFGTVPQPTVKSSCFPEWEEWPQGDEATIKFPDDPSARCFWLGRADDRQGLRDKGQVAAQQGRTRKARKAPSKELLPPPRSEMRPIVRCRADADLIVEFAGMLFEPPVCAHCSACIASYTLLVPFVTLVANFAYRPASVLIDHFVSVFPPHTAEFHEVVNRLALDGRTPRCSLHALRERVEQVPIAFLLSLALIFPRELLQQSGIQGELNSWAAGRSYGAKGKAGRRRAGSGDCVDGGETGGGGLGDGDCGGVWEEVQSWFVVAMLPAGAMEGGGPGCSGSQSIKRATMAHKRLVAEMYDCSLLPRFCEDLKHTGGRGSACGSSDSKLKGKKAEEAAYLKAWPGGFNPVACLREMLLGEPCYHPASDAARSTSAAVRTRVASSTAESGYSATAAASFDDPTIIAALSIAAADVSTASVTSNVGASGGAACAGRVCGTTATQGSASAACGERVCGATATQRSGPAPSRGRVCGAAGCERVECGGVKLRSCGGCGKVAYCSRDCQKAHWPSHKPTCPGRTDGKRRGKNSAKPQLVLPTDAPCSSPLTFSPLHLFCTHALTPSLTRYLLRTGLKHSCAVM